MSRKKSVSSVLENMEIAPIDLTGTPSYSIGNLRMEVSFEALIEEIEYINLLYWSVSGRRAIASMDRSRLNRLTAPRG